MAEPQPAQAPQPARKPFPVSWDQFHRDARALAWRLAEAGPFEAIVCITRGGMVPAAIVARELGIRVIETVCVASYNHTTQGDLKVLKPVAPEIGALAGGGGKGVLVIDDLVDTGQTARLVRNVLPDAHYAAVYAKPHGPAAGRHLHHRGVPGHVDILSVGYRARIPAADPRGRIIGPANQACCTARPTGGELMTQQQDLLTILDEADQEGFELREALRQTIAAFAQANDISHATLAPLLVDLAVDSLCPRLPLQNEKAVACRPQTRVSSVSGGQPIALSVRTKETPTSSSRVFRWRAGSRRPWNPKRVKTRPDDGSADLGYHVVRTTRAEVVPWMP